MIAGRIGVRELLGSLPPHLADDRLRDRCEVVLGQAALVKFARRRPTASVAAEFPSQARELLARWRDAARALEAADAIR
jgi:uncharacterized protein YmfQ (DUF2313 family)